MNQRFLLCFTETKISYHNYYRTEAGVLALCCFFSNRVCNVSIHVITVIIFDCFLETAIYLYEGN